MKLAFSARVGVLLASGAWIAGGQACTPARGEAPKAAAAEIAFDHSIHAGQYQLDCQSCHAFASSSPVAGVPSLQKCMGCHSSVAAEKPAVKTMTKMASTGEPLVFERVYDLPDYVYFSHRMHLRAELACADCHGAVEKMRKVERVSSLGMGWCMDCHQARGASTDCLTCHK